tara:strand:+ start:5809 stop:6066 length:258 start_codon:yes stop_codon:yes gene_type:complete
MNPNTFEHWRSRRLSLLLAIGLECGKPSFLAEENPDWEGNYNVKYWNTDWQNIIYGNNDAYVKKIIDTGFDGVYLDIIDAFEYFE